MLVTLESSGSAIVIKLGVYFMQDSLPLIDLLSKNSVPVLESDHTQ